MALESIILILFSPCASAYSILEDEVIYDIDFMLDSDNLDKYDEYLRIIEQERNFLNNCQKVKEDNGITGNWILVNRENIEQKKVGYSLCELTEIGKYNDYIFLDNYGNRSFLYLSDKGRLYIFTRWLNVIRMLEIEDGKLFFYITQNDKWVLDPIHNNGEFYFIKK